MPTFQGGIDWASIFAPLLAGEQTMMQNQRQKQDYQLRQQEDQQSAAYQAAQEAYQNKQLQIQAGEAGVDPQTGQPIHHAPLNLKPGLSPTEQEAAYRKASNDAFAAGDQSAATYYAHQADSLSTDVLKGAETGKVKAQTRLTNEQANWWQNKLHNDLTEIAARGAAAGKVAAIRAAYHKAGGGTGSVDAERRAWDAAIREAQRQQINLTNSALKSDYERAMGLHDADPDNNPAPATPNYIPVPVAGPGGTNVYVLPSGQVVPNPPKSSTPTPAARPPAATPPAQPGGGGIMHGIEQGIGNLIHGIFGGGGNQGQHLSAKNRAGQPIHSDDGGKTWQPGQ